MVAKMSKWVSIFLVVSTIIRVNSLEITIPCHKSDPHLDDCLRKLILSAKQYVKEGIPSIIPSLDSLHLKNPVKDFPVKKFKFSLFKLNLNGLSDYDVLTLGSSNGAKTFNVEILFNKLTSDGSYGLNGSIVGIQLSGAPTNFALTLDKLKVHFTVDLCKVTDNDEEHMCVNNLKVDASGEDGTVDIGELFSGHSFLNTIANTIANHKLSKLLNGDINKILQKHAAELQKLANTVLAKIPATIEIPD